MRFSHVQCTYMLVLLLYKKLQFINRGGMGITLKCPSSPPLPPPLQKKYTIIIVIGIFDSHTCTVTSVLWLSVDLRKVTYNLKVP